MDSDSNNTNKSQINLSLSTKDRICAPINTNLSNQGRSPFNAFVTNELSPLTQTANNPRNYNYFSRPIKKFSFSEQIHDVLQDPSLSHFSKEKDLESYFLNDDNLCSPLLGINKLSHQTSQNFAHEEHNILNDFVNNNKHSNSNIIENMLGFPTFLKTPRISLFFRAEPIQSSENLKKITAQPLISYNTQLTESEISYKTPTFCHGASTNSEDFSYKSPKFAGTPQNSFHLDSTPRNPVRPEISNEKLSEILEKNEKEPAEIIGCNCKKSRCLKLYCECFANDKFCVKNCNCHDCKNNAQNQEMRKKAKNSILIKNPNAFASKVTTRTELNPQQNVEKNTVFIKKGCNCKKSNCRKKYCECYGVGLKCTDICKCEDCKNKEGFSKKSARNDEENSENSLGNAPKKLKKESLSDFVENCEEIENKLKKKRKK